MQTYLVIADVGTIDAIVVAESPDDAVAEAIAKWDSDAVEIFSTATFEIRLSE